MFRETVPSPSRASRGTLPPLGGERVAVRGNVGRLRKC